MLRLLLLRHAKTIPFTGSGDRERYLTGRGKADAARMGAYLAAEKLLPQLAVHSGAQRSQETLTIALSHMPKGIKVAAEPRLYEATRPGFLRAVQDCPDDAPTVLLVGHNPSMAEMARAFAGTGDDDTISKMSAKFPTAALAVVDFEADHWRAVELGEGALVRFVTPADIGGGAGE